MDNQQVSGILFENIDINKLTSKTINNNVAKNIIYNLHQEYKYFKDNYNLNKDVVKYFKRKIYNQYEKILPVGFKKVGDGTYSVNSNGIVINSRTRQQIKLRTDKKGYLRFDSNKHCSHLPHRLVAEAFVTKNDNTYTQINHIDGNKCNNNYSNLEWCNNSINMKHTYDNGYISKSKLSSKAKGEGNSQAKLTKDDVLYIRANIIDKKELANKYGVSVATIYDIIKGRSWKHI
jgi:hypothetical protein